MKHPLQAVIFCGGLGTRLRPITNSLPKPMVPILDKPFLEYLLLQLSSEGIKRFILLTGYMGEIIHEYFGDGSKWGGLLNIHMDQKSGIQAEDYGNPIFS